MMTTEAGNGDHHVHLINSVGDVLEPGVHYLGIDAVSWFLNKQSSFFTDRTASGTVEIAFVDAKEKYSIALGSFELSHGARTAPVFNKPLLPDRQYRGGGISITVSLVFYKRDTLPSSLLKGASDASLSIVAGMVETATIAGPAEPLTAAGTSLLDGVRAALKSAAKQEHVFGGEGFLAGLQPGHIRGDSSYLLMHRGAQLDEGRLGWQKQGAVVVPTYDGHMLEDGAWILLRLRRSEAYPGERPWRNTARALRSELENLVTDVGDTVLDCEEGLQQLAPAQDGRGETLFDRYVALRRVIQADGVISESEARAAVRGLAEAVRAARQSLTADEAGGVTAWERLGAISEPTDFVAEELKALDRAREQSRLVVSARPALAPPIAMVL